ncbi:CRISPR-associated helicase Cas3' [Streptomyces sp. NPDC058202]|uniref:CRISPR-associated helicase Cas3' n=1 Tax=Streptomyces sp. NPDC058202 TaxID=3346380 RepID=UPI0036ED42B0
MPRMIYDPDESVWGKSRGLDPEQPPYPLVRHLLDTAAMALHLWDVYLSDAQRRSIAGGMGCSGDWARARGLVGLCAGLHDLGKVSGFQFCSRHGAEHLGASLSGDRTRMGGDRLGHDVAGMRAAADVLAVLGFDADGETVAAERVAEIIGGHHGRFYRNEGGISSPFFGGLAWEEQRVAHASAVFGLLGSPVAPEKFKAVSAVLVTGVVILADWLVSQGSYLRGRQEALEPSLGAHFAQSGIDAASLLADAALVPVRLRRTGFAEAYGIKGEPNPLQRSVMEELPDAVQGGGRGGILLVTAAPGDGKSEAALEAERVFGDAFGTRGFAFLLPTMATSDQMYGRVSGALLRQSGQGAGLTLVHSMAWLNSAYSDAALDPGQGVVTCDGDEGSAGRERVAADVRPRQWLRGSKRPLLAQFAVGTVDQALMSVLPVRHNMLRLLALTGKTLIVDEAHAYDPYMQVLLGRLLNWLGAFGVPVVLLSATLPASVSDRLVKEYLQGAGHDLRVLREKSFPAPYPGWLYVDGALGEGTQMSAVRRQEQAVERRMDLAVTVEPVVHGSGGVRNRLAVIERLVEPAAAGEGGTVLIVCNTVGDAQETYRRLRERFDDRSHEEGGMVQLLHARFPGDVRESRTREVTGGLGRSGPRPRRRIVVATQVVEQSLDLDADVVISDVAPLSLLLQRAGRCWRHENWWVRHGYPGGQGRPSWAGQPRLIVLDPLSGGGGVPRQWGEVYSEFLLGATSKKLAELGASSIAIPEDVQDLVEAVHGAAADTFDWDTPDGRQKAAWTAHQGKDLAERGQAGLVAVPRARSVRRLHDLHSLPGDEDEWELATRLGADSVRLLCVFLQEDGRRTLDVAGDELVPDPPAGGRLTAVAVRAVMRRTIPVRSSWFSAEDADRFGAPQSWSEHPMLSDVRVVCQPVAGGVAGAVVVGGKTLYLDADLGLVRR